MENSRNLKRKIATVGKIAKITNAMKVVATNRLRRVEARARTLAAFSGKLQMVAARLAGALGPEAHPLLVRRTPVQRALLIVVGGDRGLCGAYNSNVLRLFNEVMDIRRQSQELQFAAVGARMTKTLKKRGYDLALEIPQVDSEPGTRLPQQLAELATGKFLAGEVDDVSVFFTHYVNPLVFQPTQRQLLPLAPPSAGRTSGTGTLENRPYEFEPPAETILANLLPWHLEVQLEAMILESAASEFAARVSAMTNASDNAADITKALTLTYNRVRQAAITGEILEVASGAEALAQG